MSASVFQRTGITVSAAVAALGGVLVAPAQAQLSENPEHSENAEQPADERAGHHEHDSRGQPSNVPDECEETERSIECHFDVEPGNYHVEVVLGGDEPGSTGVRAETHRAMLDETPTRAGQRLERGFTVNVRDPEGEPTKDDVGTPGLDLEFSGESPKLADVRVTEAPDVRQLFVIGDSTVCDQDSDEYAGWGQQLPRFFGQGISVANYADSGEGTASFLAKEELFASVESRLRPGDTVLVQLGHNDKETPAEDYRANLREMAERITAAGGNPVFVTPVVRRWFDDDGTLQDIGVHITDLANLPAEMRGLARDMDLPVVDLTTMTQRLVEDLGEGPSRDLYVTGDSTHTNADGARRFATLLRDDLKRQELLPGDLFR